VILDCESLDSALGSLAWSYEATSNEVVAFLKNVDPETVPLPELVRSEFGNQKRMWESVYWFHLTRVPPGTDFDEGILPLHLALSKIWDAIIGAVRTPKAKRNLKRLREEGVPNRLYKMKVVDPLHAGPYAMLVREAAFHAAEMGNHDYLEVPEIIEDICDGYEKRFGHSILSEVTAALQACIVKFEAVDQGGPDLALIVFNYCWCMIHDVELSIYSNTCYDARDTIIPRLAIREVKFL